MSFGDIRKDIQAEFGSFFEDRGFEEVEYKYDREHFGNEIWHLRDQSGFNIRIIRDRSQLFVELQSTRKGYIDSGFYLKALGYSQAKYNNSPADGPPQPGISKALVSDTIAEWPRMVALARSEASAEL